jgi:hypothetical protein
MIHCYFTKSNSIINVVILLEYPRERKERHDHARY